MNPAEFESHIKGAVNSALSSGVHPTIVVTVLEGTKLDVLMAIRQQMAMQTRAKQQAENGHEPRIITPDGFQPPQNAAG